MKNFFSYDELETGQKQFSISGDYGCRSNQHFHTMQNIHLPDAELDKGSKLHLSVDKRDLAKAWDIVCAQIIKFRIGVAKVANSQTAEDFSDFDEPQRGKMITIYDNGKDPDEWQEIVQKIEMGLAQEKIKPGFDVVGDNPVSGSQYFHYRHDKDPHGNYVSASQAGRINPDNPANPYYQDLPFEIIDMDTVYADSNLKRVPKPQQNVQQNLLPEPHIFHTAIDTNDMDEDLAFIMALPFEYGVKDDVIVMRADLSKLRPDQFDSAQEKLKRFGIHSEKGASGMHSEGSLKVDADTKRFEALQDVYLQRLAQREILRYGNSIDESNQINAVRINLRSGGFPYTNQAIIQSVRRINQKSGNEIDAYDIDSSALFPDDERNVNVKIDDPAAVQEIMRAVKLYPVSQTRSVTPQRPSF